MGKTEGAMWASKLWLLDSFMSGGWSVQRLAVCSIRAAGVFVCLLEYPHSKRGRGTSVERTGQYCFTLCVKAFGPLTRNYYIRAFLHAALCVPGGFMLATVLGCVCLGIASLIYLLLFTKSIGSPYCPAQSHQSMLVDSIKEPPQNPPPRPPPELRRKKADKLETAANDNPMSVTINE